MVHLVDEKKHCPFFGEHSKDFEHLRKKHEATCKRLDKFESEEKQRWRDHLKFADESLSSQRAWKRVIEEEYATLRLEIANYKHELEEEILNMALKFNKEISKQSEAFNQKINDTKEEINKVGSRVTASAITLLIGLLLNLVVQLLKG